jgi:hypothetical protein
MNINNREGIFIENLRNKRSQIYLDKLIKLAKKSDINKTLLPYFNNINIRYNDYSDMIFTINLSECVIIELIKVDNETLIFDRCDKYIITINDIPHNNNSVHYLPDYYYAEKIVSSMNIAENTIFDIEKFIKFLRIVGCSEWM